MQVATKKVKMFKIKNRRGFACVCLNHLTEGKTTHQAYFRMEKALKRSGLTLKKTKGQNLKKLMTNL